MKPLEINEVRELYEEYSRLQNQVKPPAPDPAIWPPAGWAIHPQDPSLVYQVKTADALKEELFGSAEKDLWLKESRQRIAQIEKILIGYFYPEPKEEGTQREIKDGFVTMLKTGLIRVVDSEAVEQILEECDGQADSAINWEAKLKLKEYRALDDAVKVLFDNCLEEKPAKPIFEIASID